MTLRIGVVLLVGLTLGGCVLFGGPADRALRRTPAYRDGYSDGCAAASTPSANPRNTQDSLTEEDRIYRRGWAGGYQACKRTSVAPGDAPHTPLSGGIPTN
ncbi:MAG TPA: hypothetical protein VIJ85_12865 [Rhizomicrobium sp.]